VQEPSGLADVPQRKPHSSEYRQDEADREFDHLRRRLGFPRTIQITRGILINLSMLLEAQPEAVANLIAQAAAGAA
jgi:hypothetical protein